MRGEILDGRYRLTEPVGAGGMGRVWRAVDERIGREVAVKVLSRIDEDTSVTRFVREARVVGGLSSPHIVTLHDFGEAQVSGQRVLYLVMEHLQGRDLGAVLESRRPGLPDPREVMAWGVEICAGLETAHRAGVVHRDIKPANILLTEAGTVKILDFGIARMLSTAASAPRAELTGTGFMIGTPLYMSPEQIQAPDVLDSRSDLYSLGCLLHHLLTGRPPFTGAGTAVLARHLGEVPEPPSAHRPELREFGRLDPLIMRLLAKEPGERPKDAAEVSTLLRLASEAGRGSETPGASAVTAVTALTESVPHVGAPAAPSPPAAAPTLLFPPTPRTGPAPAPPTGPSPTPAPERLRIARRAPRDGTVSPRSVAATWLAGAGTALVTCVLVLLCTPAGTQWVLILSVGACLAGMACVQVFTDIYDPRSKTLGQRIGSAVALALVLGVVGTAIEESATDDVSSPFLPIAFATNIVLMTVGVLIADRLIALFRLSARAALLISVSGWVNSLVTWGMLAYCTPLGGIGALPVGCAVWPVTALGLGRLLASDDNRTPSMPPA